MFNFKLKQTKSFQKPNFKLNISSFRLNKPVLKISNKLFGDYDKDRVMNFRDCKPFDPKRHGGEAFGKYLERRDVPIIGTKKEKRAIQHIFERNPELIEKAKGIKGISFAYLEGGDAVYDTKEKQVYFNYNLDKNAMAERKGENMGVMFEKDKNKLLRHEFVHHSDNMSGKILTYPTPKERLSITSEIEKRYDTKAQNIRDNSKIDFIKQYPDYKKHSSEQQQKYIEEFTQKQQKQMDELDKLEFKENQELPWEQEAYKAQEEVPERKKKVVTYLSSDSEQRIHNGAVDSDGDGVINALDCEPNNPDKQDFVKETGVPVVDYPEQYKSYTHKQTVKMPPRRFLEKTKTEAVFADLKRHDVDSAMQLSELPLETYIDSWEGKDKQKYAWKEQHRVDRVKQGLQEGKNIPGLYLEVDEQGIPVGHEGRHRAVAAMELGIEQVPVHIMTRRKLIPRENSWGDWDMSKGVTKEDTIPGEFEGKPSHDE